MSVQLSMRRVDILASVALYIAAKGGIFDKRQIAESWRRADDESFARLSLIAGMKPNPVLKGVLVDELERMAEA